MIPELRHLAHHAIACWVSEGPVVCAAGNMIAGNRGRTLYYRTRAVVVYDRVRAELLRSTVTITPEVAVHAARWAP